MLLSGDPGHHGPAFLGNIGRVTAAQRAAGLRTTEQKAPLTKQEVDRIHRSSW